MCAYLPVDFLAGGPTAGVTELRDSWHGGRGRTAAGPVQSAKGDHHRVRHQHCQWGGKPAGRNKVKILLISVTNFLSFLQIWILFHLSLGGGGVINDFIIDTFNFIMFYRF